MTTLKHFIRIKHLCVEIISSRKSLLNNNSLPIALRKWMYEENNISKQIPTDTCI